MNRINVRLYDNGGTTADRFTAVVTGRYRHKNGGQFFYRGMSDNPFHPQGIGMSGCSNHQIDAVGGGWGGVAVGRKNHLGTRIKFESAPLNVRICILQDLVEFYPKRKDYAEALKELRKEKQEAGRLPKYGKNQKTKAR